MQDLNTATAEKTVAPDKKSSHTEWGLKLATIPLEFRRIELHDNFRNSRADLGNLMDLQRSIEEVGLMNPPIVWELQLDDSVLKPWGTVDKQYFLISGFRRHRALREIIIANPSGFTADFQIEVRVFRGTIEQALGLNLSENLQREDLTAIEIAQTVKYIIDQTSMSQNEVAVMVGKPPSWVSVTLSFMEKATDELIQCVKDRLLPYTVALRVADLPKDLQKKLLDKFHKAIKEGESAFKATKKLKEDMDEVAPKKKARSFKEILEKFQIYRDMDLTGLSPEQRAFIFGMQRIAHWAMGNDFLTERGWTDVISIQELIEEEEKLDRTPKVI